MKYMYFLLPFWFHCYTYPYKVYEISFMVGFNEYKHFATVFKKYIKASPLEFTKGNSYIKGGNKNEED
jgi:AraC-like DNA-binding protein